MWVRFSSFIDFIIKVDQFNTYRVMNQHWAPIYKQCFVCYFQDQIQTITHTEKLTDESFEVFKSLGIDDKVPSRETVAEKRLRSKRDVNENTVRFFKENLTKNQIQELYKIYEFDFIMFGYSIDEYL